MEQDIQENRLQDLDAQLLPILLIDRTTRHNIIWATDTYKSRGEGYAEHDEITVTSITGDNGNVIVPRMKRLKSEQEARSRDKAEVFTPSWVCNKQNNLVDEQWFGRKDVFNIESENGWSPVLLPVQFDGKKTWQKYVDEKRLEITCGEAPYLVSRYDAVSGEIIPIASRIGLLDRKLRVVNENTNSEDDWWTWTLRAYQSVYGFEYQGDNLLLARENLLATFIDVYKERFLAMPDMKKLRKIAMTISWNIWQMDGIRMVVPGSCKSTFLETVTMLGDTVRTEIPCKGCSNGTIHDHNGIYCKVYDWRDKSSLLFKTMMKGAQ